MKRAGNYGYSPEQLARVNARRQARGRDILVDKKFDDPDYEKRYIGESESYAAKGNKPATPAFPSKRPSALDQYKGQKSLTDRMAERPSALGQPSSMASRRAIADEDFKKKFGKSKGVNPESIGGAYKKVIGQVA